MYIKQQTMFNYFSFLMLHVFLVFSISLIWSLKTHPSMIMLKERYVPTTSYLLIYCFKTLDDIYFFLLFSSLFSHITQITQLWFRMLMNRQLQSTITFIVDYFIKTSQSTTLLNTKLNYCQRRLSRFPQILTHQNCLLG